MLVATIIQAVSALSIRSLCAKAGDTQNTAAVIVASMRAALRHDFRAMNTPPCLSMIGPSLDRVGIGLAGADAHRVIQPGHEDLAVPDLAGAGGRGDGVHGSLDLIARNRHFQPELRHEAHGIFGAAVNLRVTLLASIAFDFRDGHAVGAERRQRLADLLEPERLDDGRD